MKLAIEELKIGIRKNADHWECATVTEASHKQAIVTVVEHKSEYVAMGKVANKTADPVGQGQDANLRQRQRILRA
jgi:IS30 family transposase